MAKKSVNTTLDLFPNQSATLVDNSSTFGSNMSLPIHGWYRYTAGFSAEWVRSLITEQRLMGRTHVIDPFAGSGTVLLESEFQGIESKGLESQPYIYKIASAKLLWNTDPRSFTTSANKLLQLAKSKTTNSKTNFPELILKCFPLPILYKLEALKQAWLELEVGEDQKDLLWFIITAILRTCSPVGTAQWQYIQPTKLKAKVIDPFVAFEIKVRETASDMIKMQQLNLDVAQTDIYYEDSRNIISIPDGWGDLVITSPPYANNYDYADATRLEMTFWGYITGWAGLQDNVRSGLIRACTQHVGKLASDVDKILASPRIKCIQPALHQVYNTLKAERLSHGGKKNYHFMIAAYFKDMADVIHSLRRVTRDGTLVCFVVGDSAPYGIHVPVDIWLGEIALDAGFTAYQFEKLRDRNVKWKNRKHTHPLHEGRLWING